MAGGMAEASRKVGKLTTAGAALLVCDVQNVFQPLIHQMGSVVQGSSTLLAVAKEAGVPVAVTEQYSKAFGPTVDEVWGGSSRADWQHAIVEKSKFSMVCPEVMELAGSELSSVILTGIEAHVCVQQTALDLLEMGVDVHLVVDAISSQRVIDRDTALTVSWSKFRTTPATTHPSHLRRGWLEPRLT